MKCTYCGKFTAYLDPNKKPIVRLVTPDSDKSEEEIEIICWNCQQDQNKLEVTDAA